MQERVVRQTVATLETETPKIQPAFAKDQRLDEILEEFSGKLNNLAKSQFTIEDIAIATYGTQDQGLQEQIRNVKFLVNGVKNYSTPQRFIWVFDKESAFTLRVALELRYQGYSVSEIHLLLGEILQNPSFSEKLGRSQKRGLKFSPKKWLSQAKRSRKRIKDQEILASFLPIGYFDKDYAQFVQSQEEIDDITLLYESRDEERQTEGLVFDKPPASNQVLKGLSDPGIHVLEQVRNQVRMWSPLDAVSTQKLETLGRIGVNQRQVLSIFYAFEFFHGNKVMDLARYDNRHLVEMLNWYIGVKASKEIKLSDLIAVIEEHQKEQKEN